MKKVVLGRFYYDKKNNEVVIVRQKSNTSSVLATRHSPVPYFIKARDLREATAEECELYKKETGQRKKRDKKRAAVNTHRLVQSRTRFQGKNAV